MSSYVCSLKKSAQMSFIVSPPPPQVLSNGSLAVSAVRLEDQGTYHCTATNALLDISRTSEGAVLTVLGEWGS